MGTIFHGNQPYSGGGVLNIVHKTWEQYQALSSVEKHDASKYYFVPDAPAQGVPGVVAELQDEVDAINSKIDHGSVSANLNNDTFGSAITKLKNAGYDASKLTINSKILMHTSNGITNVYSLSNLYNQYFVNLATTGSGGSCYQIRMDNNTVSQTVGSAFYNVTNTSIAGVVKIEIVY